MKDKRSYHLPAALWAISVLAIAFTASSMAETRAPQGISVLFVGDSISGSKSDDFSGYSWIIEEMRPDWEISRISASTSASLVSRLESRPEAFKGFSVIYFNCGLHSIRQDRFEDTDDYAANLSKAVDLLKQIDDKVLLVWRTTTPTAKRASGGRDGSLVPVYNEVSLRVMKEKGVMVDDLHAALMPYYEEDHSRGGSYLAPDGTHWVTEAQRTIIAPHVVQFIQHAVSATSAKQ